MGSSFVRPRGEGAVPVTGGEQGTSVRGSLRKTSDSFYIRDMCHASSGIIGLGLQGPTVFLAKRKVHTTSILRPPTPKLGRDRVDPDLLSQLWVAWQPIVDLSQGMLVGHEALIRGPVDSPWATPAALFPWAEESGCARDLEQRCRALALAPAATIWESGHYLFLNVDGRWPKLPEPWDHRAVNGCSLVLEFSERQPLVDNPALLSAMARWRHAGHLLALDDYGTGYATATVALAIQPHIIKVDRALIAGIDQDARKQSIVRAIRGWTQDLNIRLVAEGIETAGELACAQDLGCDYGQGFLLGRPAPTLAMETPGDHPRLISMEDTAARSVAPALALYVDAIRDASVPSYVVDTRRRMVGWNRAAEALLGFTAETLVGHACFRSPLDHQDRAGHRLCVGDCPLIDAMAQRMPVRERVSVRTRTGSRRVVDVSVVPILDTATGRVAGALEQFQLAAGWEPVDGDEPHVTAEGNGLPGFLPIRDEAGQDLREAAGFDGSTSW